jgi:zinc-binding alcohol dehydrogenase/oxidoreductase
MKAVVLPGVDLLEVREVASPRPVAGEALIELKAAALNHRDVWIRMGQYAGLKFPCTPGSDGSGVVKEVGEGVDRSWVGRDVIINPSFGWGSEQNFQGSGFTILGLPHDGTFAGQIAVPVEQLSSKPAHLSWEEAAALPLAGLTAYRAIFSRAGLKRGERLLVSGVGGGVATFALQFGLASGADVWVTSSSAEKREHAQRLGAKGGFDYTQRGWAKDVAEKVGLFDVIIDGAGGPGFESLIDLAAPGGRVVFYGATRGNPPVLPMRKVFWRQISLLGTTMGSPEDWAGLLRFTSEQRLKPVISEIFPIERAADAFALMQRGDQFGKIVLKIA